MNQIADGVSKVLYFRKLGDTKPATLVLQQEHSKSYKRDREAVVTKAGRIFKKALLEDELSIKALQSTADDAYKMLDDSIVDDFALEVWEVDLAKKSADGKFQSEYRQGWLTEWEATSAAEDDPTVEGTFVTYGKRQKGLATVPPEDLQANGILGYVFHDMIASDVADDGLADLASQPVVA
ncbi:phage major tail protein, TP901-1 family [Macrococcus equipercicus]|uniref:Phage major tail protein, TP901-1 family n=1 Tax=Macrococcus equipercicus TaxID=69967 RepID=A0A9Q9BUK7_9STAP|nr:phage major tail protein, TP901-1 family [Macrococcus equipercicus]UTH14769.1 phage major tail protein, TP901-1 family [Macrococcus equipercicus]